MRLTGEQFAALLEKPLLPVYTLYGDDELLPLEAADSLRAKACSAGFSERVVLTALTGFNWQALRESSGNLSLFGDRRLIDLRIPNGKPGKEGSAALDEYCATCGNDPNLCLLISLPALDWREEKAVWLEHLAQAGALIKFKAPGLEQLPGWIAMRLMRQQQSADRDSLRFIAERVEGNLLAAHQEIQKLGLLYPPGSLNLQQVKEAVLNVARYDLDALRMAFLLGDLARFTRTLEGLRAEDEPPPLILWGLTEEIRALTTIRSGIDAGRPLDGLLRAARAWGTRQNVLKRAVQRCSLPYCLAMMKECARLDRLIKGIGTDDIWDGFLQLGLLRCRQAGQTPSTL